MKNILLPLLSIFVVSGFVSSVSYAEKGLKEAIFAGGCFWCMESDFEKVPGVTEVISGYTDGVGANPTYEDYSKKGYIEAVKISYDPKVISYKELVSIFWLHIDPLDPGGQFCDRGHAYTSAVFYNSEEEKKLAEESRNRLKNLGRFNDPIETKIIKASKFYLAEDYHQNYYKKNPIRYKFYRFNCGRDRRLQEVWGDAMKIQEKTAQKTGYKKPSEEELRKKLTPLQFKVTQEEGTEPAFKNEYWDNKKEGIYVDIVSGEPLFSSKDKFKSGTGWPSFTQPLVKDNIVEVEDRSWFSVTTEVRSKKADSHLGHVFNDGPEPTGLRYCMNSAALRFIPKGKLKEEGYEEYEKLFEK